MANQYKYGREKEKLVARKLRARGAKVKISKGSKGPADLVAEFPTGKTWPVQVKSSRKGEPRNPSGRDLRRLKAKATRMGGTPVVAKVARNKVSLKSARSGRRLSLTKKR